MINSYAIPFLADLSKEIRLVVGAGYPMVCVRPIHDVDACVHPADWGELITRSVDFDGELFTTAFDTVGMHIETLDYQIEIFPTSIPPGFAYLDLLDEGYDKLPNGLQVWTINQMIRWKKAFNRPKDQEDIKLLIKTAICNQKKSQKQPPIQ
jgi:hypothetical protein